MSTRLFYLPMIRRDNTRPWMAANGIDPSDVLLDQTLIVKDGTIKYDAIVYDVIDGKRRKRVLNNDHVALAERTVPLVADPDEFDIQPTGVAK
jgi:hypothetical protein